MKQVRKFLAEFSKDESGASAAEYALILAIVTTGIAAAVVFLGDQITNAINEAANCITSTGCP